MGLVPLLHKASVLVRDVDALNGAGMLGEEGQIPL